MNGSGTVEVLFDEVMMYMKYAVLPPDLPVAEKLVGQYRNSEIVLRLLREHYKQLPEAREEPVTKIARLIDNRGVFLFVVVAADNAYLYGVSSAEVILVGEYPCALEKETLAFFHLKDDAAFDKLCLAPQELSAYRDEDVAKHVFCPACGVAEGEVHMLGCAVEICPWCRGQLSRCNCRFEQMHKEELTDEEDLETLMDLLEAKGRIVFKRTQAPAYPGTSRGLDQEKG